MAQQCCHFPLIEFVLSCLLMSMSRSPGTWRAMWPCAYLWTRGAETYWKTTVWDVQEAKQENTIRPQSRISDHKYDFGEHLSRALSCQSLCDRSKESTLVHPYDVRSCNYSATPQMLRHRFPLTGSGRAFPRITGTDVTQMVDGVNMCLTNLSIVTLKKGSS